MWRVGWHALGLGEAYHMVKTVTQERARVYTAMYCVLLVSRSFNRKKIYPVSVHIAGRNVLHFNA